jgi:predicted Zn-dependent protease with MMP-like domain
MDQMIPPPANWDNLLARAQSVIETTLAELPAEVLAEARQVPCLFEERCQEDPDILGTYGHFEPGEVSPANGPIILYLEAIADFCREESEDYDEEVRLTYLHELGHHLGWDEGDLEERGLE